MSYKKLLKCLSLHDAAKSGDLQSLHLALSAGADVNSRVSEGGDTALLVAARAGHAAVVQALLVAGADANAVAFGGETALFWAAGTYDCMTPAGTSIVHALIAAGADVNAADWDSRTLLVVAATIGNTAAVQALAAAGANVNATDMDQRTALFVAAEGGFAATVQVLLAAGAAANTADVVLAMREAVIHGNAATVKVLLPHCSTACLTEQLEHVGYWSQRAAAAVLLHELAARDEAASAAAALTPLPHQPKERTAVFSMAMFGVWIKATAEADAQLAAMAKEQQELATVARSVPDAVVSLAAQGS